LQELSSRVDNIPLFTSDELVHYKTILGEIYADDPNLDYAVVHKTRQKGRIVNVGKRIVYGDEQRIYEKIKLSPGNTINTSYVERQNGTLRQTDSHLRRKSQTFAKEMPYFKARLAVIILIYNCIKSHHTLSKNPNNSRTPRTPALVAKLIDKNWTVEFAFKKPIIK
jgi:hypothetical protein